MTNVIAIALAIASTLVEKPTSDLPRSTEVEVLQAVETCTDIIKHPEDTRARLLAKGWSDQGNQPFAEPSLSTPTSGLVSKGGILLMFAARNSRGSEKTPLDSNVCAAAAKMDLPLGDVAKSISSRFDMGLIVTNEGAYVGRSNGTTILLERVDGGLRILMNDKLWSAP